MVGNAALLPTLPNCAFFQPKHLQPNSLFIIPISGMAAPVMQMP